MDHAIRGTLAWLLCAVLVGASCGGSSGGSAPPPRFTTVVPSGPAPLLGSLLGPAAKSHLPTVPVNRLVAGDFDGDGDRDLVVIAGLSPYLRLWVNDGGGRFTDATAAAGLLDAYGEYDVAVEDLDEDGDLDLVVTGLRPGMRLLRNDGEGRFDDVTAASLSAAFAGFLTGATPFHFGDVDGDGYRDLLMERVFVPGMIGSAVLRNDGTGGFHSVLLTPAAFFGVNFAAIFDADGDGDRDLFGSRRVLFNRGGGAFELGPVQNIPVGDDVRILDIDGDGDLDVSQWNGLFLNDGLGTFADASERYHGERLGEGEFVDLDADGDLDITFGGHAWANDGTGRFARVESSSGLFGTPIDVDADLDVDFVERGSSHATLRLADGALRAHTVMPNAYPFHALGERTPVAVDFDRDGIDDLAIGGHLELGTGSGAFARAVDYGANVEDSLFADVDADGRVDWIQGKSGFFRVARNRGGFRFEVPTWSSGVLGAVLDANGDGALDLVAVDFNPMQSRFYSALHVGDGAGGFTADPTAFDRALAKPIAAADIDGDGDIDLLSRTGPYASVWWNVGGRFEPTSLEPIPIGIVVRTVGLADIDSDGDLDCLVGASGGIEPASWLRVFRNDGGRTFVDVSESALPRISDLTEQVAMVDLDGDGDLDLLRTNELQLRGYESDGRGRFFERNSYFVRGGGGPFACGDFDGDGDLDVAVDGKGVLWGALRQVRAPYAALLGEPYQIDLYAESESAGVGAIVRPFVELDAPLRVQVDPLLGRWYLGAGAIELPAVTVASGALVSSTAILIPSDTSLVGHDLASQAIVQHGPSSATWRFTNVAVDRVLR